MLWYEIVILLLIWNVLGLVGLGFGKLYSQCGALDLADGFEFFNPVHIHHYNKVNWFGAFVVCLIYTALAPAAAFLYWFYKICTVGRK